MLRPCTRHAPTLLSARLVGLTSPPAAAFWQRLLETAPLECDLAVLDEYAAAAIKMVQAAMPLPTLPPPPPPQVGVPARALAAPTAEESAVKALVAAVRFACLQFLQRPHSDGGPQWQRLSGLLEFIAPAASQSRPVGARAHPNPDPSAAPSYALVARLGKLRAEMAGFLRQPHGESATRATVVPHPDDYEARRKFLIAALGAAAKRWTPPALPVLRVMLASSSPAPAREQHRQVPDTPRPQLLGTQVRVLWGDEWYQGVGGDSKVEDGVWITHVAYDASGGWPKCSKWHNLANETWEQM